MTTKILLLADIHGNYPALDAVGLALNAPSFDHIVNCGDSLVYAPFPNETIAWLISHKVISILGNTDKKVIRLLTGKPIKKPSNPEKRVMYTSTAADLTKVARHTLLTLKESATLFFSCDSRESSTKKQRLGIFHGSPIDPEEFLFADTADSRFIELADQIDCDIVVTGHSHSPYHKLIAATHFINPGSVGRMFDGDPRASCATLEINGNQISVRHHRVAYQVNKVVEALQKHKLPPIYAAMFQQGKKLN